MRRRNNGGPCALLPYLPLIPAIVFCAIAGGLVAAHAQAHKLGFSNQWRGPMSFTPGRLQGSQACGLPCADFIVAEGIIGAGSSLAYLFTHTQIGARKVPILLDSPGGIRIGMALLGRMWRRLGVTIVVARARERPCGRKTPACADPVKVFDIAADKGECASACPFSFMGGVVRIVPAGARLGVHSPHLDTTQGIGKALADIDPSIAREVAKEHEADFAALAQEMGVSREVGKRVADTPNDDMDWLSPEDVERYRFSTTSLAASGLPPALVKALSSSPGALTPRQRP